VLNRHIIILTLALLNVMINHMEATPMSEIKRKSEADILNQAKADQHRKLAVKELAKGNKEMAAKLEEAAKMYESHIKGGK